ncbi:hypothetical protein [Helicobacter pylori]|nr:hypothetical protein [Helicobacter pylori]
MLEMKVPVLSATLREVWQALILKKKCSHLIEMEIQDSIKLL